jgi:transcriptional regulator of acetoin/glycerol metabolism
MIPETIMHDLKSLSRAVRGGTLEPLRMAEKAFAMGISLQHQCSPEPETFNLAELEKRALTRAIAKTKNIIDAARLLGIGKTTAYRKLKEYGITVNRVPDVCPKCGQALLPLHTLIAA